MSNFKAIFFDNDGLLVDTETLWLEACREVLAPLGIEVTDEFYVNGVLNTGGSLLDYFGKEKGMSPEQIEKMRKERNDIYRKMIEKNVEVIDGVRETLEQLHGKFLMGIVTTCSREHFNIIMDKTGLRKFFTFFITFDDVVNVKPNPEPYLKALEISGLQKEQCLVLEDSRRGVQAAKAAGLTCFAIPEGWTRHQDFSIADKVLGNMREVLEIIK